MKTLLLRSLSIVFSFALSFNLLIAQSNVTGTINWKGEKVTGMHNGTIDLKSASLEMENGVLKGGEFTIDMTTLACMDLEGQAKQNLEGHLASDDFFSIAKFPTASLKITNVMPKENGAYSVTGNLMIKGISKPVTFDAQIADGMAKAMIKVDRTEYDIRYGSTKFFDNLKDKAIKDMFTLDVVLKI